MRIQGRNALRLLMAAVAFAALAPGRANAGPAYSVIDLGSAPFSGSNPELSISTPQFDGAGKIIYGSSLSSLNAPYSGPSPASPDGTPVLATFTGISAGNYTAGTFYTQAGVYGFVSNGSSAVWLPGPFATAINSEGQAVTTDGVEYSYFYNSSKNSVDRILGLNASTTNVVAYGLNDLGQIVGQSNIGTSTPTHAFLSDGFDAAKDLNELIAPNSGWTLVTATAINDAGDILGIGTVGTSGDWHYFELTPTAVPEPTTLALFCAASLFPVARRLSRLRSRVAPILESGRRNRKRFLMDAGCIGLDDRPGPR